MKKAYLLDMLLAAREIQALSADLNWEGFQQSKLHQYALVKLIEIIGEAARAISEDVKAIHPEIPWVPIIDMRNHLVHRYFRVQNHITPLIAQLEPLVPSNPLGQTGPA